MQTVETGQAIATLARELPRGHRYPRHADQRGRLLFASRGVLTVRTSNGAWTVPPQQAVWLPPNRPHEVACVVAAALSTLYIASDLGAAMPRRCCVLTVSPFLRELILRMVAMPPEDQASARGRRLALVILDELAACEPAPLHLPLPADCRVRAVADALLDSPGDTRKLEAFADLAGTSVRTLTRLFMRETGMSFGEWRQRLRILEAITMLAGGRPVTTVACDLGYQSPSAFIAMFRRVVGAPPAKYFRDGNNGRKPA